MMEKVVEVVKSGTTFVVVCHSFLTDFYLTKKTYELQIHL